MGLGLVRELVGGEEGEGKGWGLYPLHSIIINRVIVLSLIVECTVNRQCLPVHCNLSKEQRVEAESNLGQSGGQLNALPRSQTFLRSQRRETVLASYVFFSFGIWPRAFF